MKERTYVCCDLKSFYASVECVERGLDPLTTNLVVADAGRTEKTICLAVSPSLKSYGISGRARLFEVVQRVKEINRERRSRAPGYRLEGSSVLAQELEEDEYYIADLIGMDVVLEDGSKFGTLKDVMETGANDVYVVEDAKGEEILLPAIRECILDVDVEKNVMTIHLMKGLI